MNDLTEFFRGLFDSDRWPPRWKCGYWSDFHGWLYIVSDLMIWLAYFLIPLLILNYFNNKKTSIRFQAVYLLFASFILLCGTTHFLDAMMFWIPLYRVNAVVRFVTGVVSLFTVYQLVRILPQITKLRTSLELEKEIALREKAEKNLAEANKRLAAFASIASHDLQEPLRKIRTFASLVYSQNENKFDDNSKLNTEKIIQSAERMKNLIGDVMTLSTLTDMVHLQSTDTKEAVAQALENLELSIIEKKAVIEVGSLPPVKGNPAYLTQLFTNLISNAIKFNENIPVVKISGKIIADHIEIRVQDNGIGLQEEHFEKVFQAFQRVHSKSKYAGTGIGLAICKRIMEIHKGEITVESVVGEGTIFIMKFPD